MNSHWWVWKELKIILNFREITCKHSKLVKYFVKTAHYSFSYILLVWWDALISRNFCEKMMRVKVHNVCGKTRNSLSPKFLPWNQFFNLFNKNNTFTNFLPIIWTHFWQKIRESIVILTMCAQIDSRIDEKFFLTEKNISWNQRFSNSFSQKNVFSVISKIREILHKKGLISQKVRFLKERECKNLMKLKSISRIFIKCTKMSSLI